MLVRCCLDANRGSLRTSPTSETNRVFSRVILELDPVRRQKIETRQRRLR